MNIEKYKIFCFDFDGVIIESSHLKTIAYNELFEKYFPDKIEKIRDYHLKNSGLVRYKKIRYICENIAKIKDADELINQMIEEYEKDIFEKVIKCPLVKGIIEYLDYLKENKKDIYVISGTPDDELKKIIELRGLAKYFVDIYGGSQMKSYWLKKIIAERQVNSNDIIFFGDGLNDYEAAAECSVDFVFRLTGENDYLKNQINYLQLYENYDKLLI
ncbi:MAG TPA: HAD hydrolase-like protein [bacterium]|nr:HAD hydrolase-like protein [bacterium]